MMHSEKKSLLSNFQMVYGKITSNGEKHVENLRYIVFRSHYHFDWENIKLHVIYENAWLIISFISIIRSEKRN